MIKAIVKEYSMTEPLVSIIIDNYNYKRFLADAVESALHQTYANVEVIVVDDGSTDGSQDVVLGYGDQVVPVLKENGGQGSAFNAGFAVSRGEIVMFLDADDLLYPNAVKRVVGEYRPEYAKLQFRLRLCDEKLLSLPDTHPSKEVDMPSGDLSKELLWDLRYPSPPTSGNAFSRWFLDEVMPMPEEPYRSGADGGFIVPLAALYGAIHSVDEELGMYRIHGNNGFFRHVSTGSTIDGKWFSRNVARDIRKEALLLEWATLLDHPVEGSPLYRSVYSMKMRLASLKLNRSDHPVSSDTKLELLYRCLIAEWKYNKSGSVGGKILTSLWFMVVAFAPLSTAEKMIPWFFVPKSRPEWVGALFNKMRGWTRAESRPLSVRQVEAKK